VVRGGWGLIILLRVTRRFALWFLLFPGGN
jgi:hypothetical protein